MLRTLKNADDASLAEIKEEMRIRHTDEVFLLFAMGSQFDHLIKLRLERLGVFCLVADPSSVTVADVRKVAPKGIIISGGPASVCTDPPPFDEFIFDLGIPILGICLGFQMWAKHVGCKVSPSAKREFGSMPLGPRANWNGTLLDGVVMWSKVLESHGDSVNARDVTGFVLHAGTHNTETAAGSFGHLHGVQFHPECTETQDGDRIFSNFLFKICGAKKNFFPALDVTKRKISELREKIGGGKVLLALSGGSDSATVAHLLRKATEDGMRLRGVYIKGIDRPDDESYVRRHFLNQDWIELRIVDATEEFLSALKGRRSMRSKRLAVRQVYKDVLEKAAAEYGAQFIAQGTLYTDISESGSGYESGADKARIKLHHNVGLNFSLAELTPLDDCVKDTGRNIGRTLGVPEDLLVRHPFPGPGLTVRIEGEITADRLRVARQMDGILIEELRTAGLYEKVWQAGAVLSRSETTCTKGDDAATGAVAIVWAVWSVNGFTARAAELPWDFIKKVSQRITNEIREIGAVTYRVSDKPPATIEMG